MWLAIPLLAVAAFAPVLGLWFVSDDFGHLLFHESLPFPKPLTFIDSGLFYRPLSTVLTWNLGYALFGTNAFPYHLISLLFHALAALFLGRAVAVIAADKRVGWLAGALFAVYPLCIEPVAWLASQWDVLGVTCVTGAVWAFAVAWRSGDRRAYIAGLIAATLAVTMKESTLPLPFTLPFVAVATELTPRVAANGSIAMQPKEWWALARKAVLWSLPFLVPTLLFVAVRFIGAGGIGGYPGTPTDIQHFFWDALVASVAEAFNPLNRMVFNRTFVQLFDLLIMAVFVVGLLLWGRKRWPLLLLSVAWWALFIGPVLNLIPIKGTPTLEGNRILYLSMIGFYIALASLVIGFLDGQGVKGRVGRVAVGLALLAAIPLVWVQLQPWTDASRQTRHIVNEVGSIIPQQPPGWTEINAKVLPDVYEGAYVLRNGLETAMLQFNNRPTRVNKVDRFRENDLLSKVEDTTGRYNIGFDFNPASKLFYVNDIQGVSLPGDPPESPTRLWDFRQCSANAPVGWEPVNTLSECTGTRQRLTANNNDPSIILPGLNIPLAGTSWVRLGVSVRYPALTTEGQIAEWFWKSDGKSEWSEDQRQGYQLATTGDTLTYWTYIRTADIGSNLDSLRFDPVNAQTDTELAWISIYAIPTTP